MIEVKSMVGGSGARFRSDEISSLTSKAWELVWHRLDLGEMRTFGREEECE